MKILGRPSPELLTSTVLMWRRNAPDLDESRLLRALQAYHPDGEAAPTVTQPGRSMSPAQAAARLQCSKGTVFNLLRAGRLPRLKLGARTTRIPEAAVSALVERGGTL